jgi:hypothetical protein
VIDPENYEQTEAPNYVLHEEGEKIYFLIKSKSDEYCFTNFAFIHVDGSGAVSKKIILLRYPYKVHSISNIYIETAGWMDADAEIKFSIDGQELSIDVEKQNLDRLQNLYKALVKISEIQHENQRLYDYATDSLKTASNIIQSFERVDVNPEEQFKAITQDAFSWMKSAKQEYTQKDFSDVFETFIKN